MQDETTTKTPNKKTQINYGIHLIEENDMVCRAVKTTGKQFEAESMAYWKKYACKENAVCVDVGAYTGLYSLVARKAGAFVFAFEPNIQVSKRFCENAEINDFVEDDEGSGLITGMDNIQLCPHALGDVENETRYFLDKPQTPLTSAGRIQAERTDYIIRCFTFDSRDLGKIDIFKIDVEGYEMKVLSGMRETIEEYKPAFIIEALSETLEKEITEYLKTFGYNDPIKCDERNLVFEYPGQ